MTPTRSDSDSEPVAGTEPTAETGPTVGSDTPLRTAGGWLAAGSLLLVVGFALHPPPSPDQRAFVATIADGPLRWTLAHAATALALVAFAVTGLVVLTAGSRLTRRWWTTSAWAVLVVSALLVTTAAVVEATAITRAAVSGDVATFETWSTFAEPYSAAFLGVLLAVAAIAGTEARSATPTTPAWAAWTGAVAAVVAAAGMVLVFVAGVAAAGVVWLAATLATGLWTLWFGVALARSGEAWPAPGEPEAGAGEPVR